ncbi:MAG: hypothetical protein J0G29_02450 [Alphaproteobacteria bacterium]|nr:hypothetical protein [Alphaproteobacteria bacterium]OJV45475.1 MAG: hypothetical protein BGO28_05110 [Alphaproteobacteria bacterium 43-37]
MDSTFTEGSVETNLNASLESNVNSNVNPHFEETFVQQGKERFAVSHQKAIRKGSYSVTQVGRILLPPAIEPLKEAVIDFVTTAMTGQATTMATAALYLKNLAPEVVSLIACRCIIDKLTQPISFTRLASIIGKAIQDELIMEAFSEQNRRLYDTIALENLKKISNTFVRRSMMRKQAAHYEIVSPEMDQSTCILVGAKLIELFCEVTGFIEIFIQIRSGREYRMVHPTAKVLESIDQLYDQLSGRFPAFGPIIKKPKDWKSFHEGGFHTLRQKFVRTFSKEHAKMLKHHAMPKVYEAVNHLQATPYAINKQVLEVAQYIWDRRENFGELPFAGLPERYVYEIHGQPTGFDEGSLAKHKYNESIKSQNLEVKFILKTAHSYKDERQLYFVHNTDFRGRVYPVTSYLSPQGNDLNRGILTFSESQAKPLGKSGLIWLKIHAANCWGKDKDSLDERINWSSDNLERIIRVAEDPYADYWWEEADKPFQFLAVCYEFLKLMVEWDDYKCALPITVDGSNNALQHFSALLLDERLGRATNMLPPESDGEKPKDFYQEVCDAATHLITIDAAHGKPEAKAWVKAINRKIVKSPVMTYYYGVTFKGMEDQIDEVLGNQIDESLKDQALTVHGDRKKSIQYLVWLLKRIIPQKAPSVESCMQLLKCATRHLAKQNKSTTWLTPSGFKVVQDNRIKTKMQIKTKLFGTQNFWMRFDAEPNNEDKADIKRQANGITANFIHSLDAAALTLCILEAKKHNITAIRTIHDSLSVVPGDMEVLSQLIRKSFQQMYQDKNLLKDFLTQTLDKETAETFWKEANISLGLLDLSQLKKATYFFA